MKQAFTEMGESITSGAITTFGSGFFLFRCFLILFVKFALLISATIAISWVMAMIFFGAMSHCVGPESYVKVEKENPIVKDGDDLVE